MIDKIPDQAFILAAGLGTRLRPYTDHKPKPLVEVAGISLLTRILNQLESAGVQTVVINKHYHAAQIEEHVRMRIKPSVRLSHEDNILNTGLGIKRGLGLLANKPMFVINGDALWENGPAAPALTRLGHFWDDQKMDILLLLQPVGAMTLTGGVGDYDLDPDGRARRSKDQTGAYMFTGLRIHHPRIFEKTPETPFSYLDLMDRAQERKRLYALVHDGSWHHISTPGDLDKVNEAFRNKSVDK